MTAPMSDNYLLDIRFLGADGEREGGVDAVCSEEEALQFADAVKHSMGGDGCDIAITAPWIAITLTKAGDKEAAK